MLDVLPDTAFVEAKQRYDFRGGQLRHKSSLCREQYSPRHLVAKTGGQPQVLAAEQVFPASLVVDAQDVYWANTGINAATGQVMRVAKPGGDPVAVASGLNWPGGLAGDSDYLYWRDDDKGLQRIAKRGGIDPDGGARNTVIENDTSYVGVAVDDTAVYVTNQFNGTLKSVAR